MRKITAVMVAVVLLTNVQAQEPAKPGPEHDVLKKREGTWDTVLKHGEQEDKGSFVYKMELGGLWLAGTMDSNLGKDKYYGRSMDTYDAKKGKYVGYWFDSMSATPMLMEGSYDKETKTLTLTGDGPNKEGKTVKWKSVTVEKDADTIVMNMHVDGVKDPMFTLTYKRKK